MTLDPLVVARACGLVAVAELGDKSQLVCLALAARGRALPVVAGATLAFALLSAVAAGVGAAIGALLPMRVVGLLAAALFAWFGVRALVSADEDDEEAPAGQGSAFALAFWSILVAELGDKTQLEVVGLAAAGDPLSVWVGATLALGSTSALGALAGRLLGTRLPGATVRRLSGVVFLGFAVWLAAEALLSGT